MFHLFSLLWFFRLFKQNASLRFIWVIKYFCDRIICVTIACWRSCLVDMFSFQTFIVIICLSSIFALSWLSHSYSSIFAFLIVSCPCQKLYNVQLFFSFSFQIRLFSTVSLSGKKLCIYNYIVTLLNINDLSRV